MIDLPNDKWLRSTKLLSYAICFDPDDLFFLWVMAENEAQKTWRGCYALTAEDWVRLLNKQDPALLPFKPVIQARLDKLHAQIAADQKRGNAVCAAGDSHG